MMLYPPTFIHLYSPEFSEKSEKFNLEEIGKYVKDMFPKMKVDLRGEFIKYHLFPHSSHSIEEKISGMAESMAGIKIRDIKRKDFSFNPLPMEIKYEMSFITGKSRAIGNIYDGFKMSEVYRKIIGEGEKNMEHCHIIFTNRLFATWDEIDKRYHLRVSVYSVPSIISLSGIVEAPAKPREYYIELQMGIPRETLKHIYKGRYIDYGDERMTDVMKGYVLQAIIFHSTGDAFCNDRDCRLFNAHWQEEIINSQLKGDYEVCPFHKKIIEKINEFMEEI